MINLQNYALGGLSKVKTQTACCTFIHVTVYAHASEQAHLRQSVKVHRRGIGSGREGGGHRLWTTQRDRARASAGTDTAPTCECVVLSGRGCQCDCCAVGKIISTGRPAINPWGNAGNNT